MADDIKPQHDHHCWLTAGGVDWRIIAARFPRLAGQDPLSGSVTVIDLSKMDFERYNAMTALWDKVMYGGGGIDG